MLVVGKRRNDPDVRLSLVSEARAGLPADLDREHDTNAENEDRIGILVSKSYLERSENSPRRSDSSKLRKPRHGLILDLIHHFSHRRCCHAGKFPFDLRSGSSEGLWGHSLL